MKTAMTRLGRHLTYANVMATVTLFLVLGGGAAFAASQLGKNSVGTKQLKKNAVTTAKIKKNAVTTAKLKNAAVTEAKVKPGSLEGADVSPAVPFGQVVHSSRGSGAVPITKEGVVYPIDNPSFTQEAGQSMLAVGGVEFEVAPGCAGPEVSAAVVLDQADPVKATSGVFPLVNSHGVIADGEEGNPKAVTGPLKRLLSLDPDAFNVPFGMGPPAAQSHSYALVIRGACSSGSGLTATSGGVDLIGNKQSG